MATGILKRTDAFSKADLADGILRESVHQVENILRLPDFRNCFQYATELPGILPHDDPDVFLESLGCEHAARGLAVLVPQLTVGIENTLAQKL